MAAEKGRQPYCSGAFLPGDGYFPMQHTEQLEYERVVF